MVRRAFKPEQIINKLREAEVLLSQGSTVGEASRKLGVTEQTYYRWRKEYGGMRAQFALAWVLRNPTITSVICGTNSIKQLEENLGAVELKVTPEEIAVCDEIWNQLHPPRFAYGSQQTAR